MIVGLFVGGDEGAVDGLGDGAFVGTVATKFGTRIGKARWAMR